MPACAYPCLPMPIHTKDSAEPPMTTDIELAPVAVPEACTAVNFLAERTGLSKSRIKLAMTRGAVWVQRGDKLRRLRRAKTTLTPPDRIGIYYSANILDTEPPEPLLIEDLGCCSIWLKPPGLLSSGSRFGDHCAIDRVIDRLLDRPTYLVHRLDQFAWGLMVLAHDRESAANLSGQFRDRQVHKVYQAIVYGRLETDVDIDAEVDGKPALSHVSPLGSDREHTLVEIRIESGRKHQIRVHLAGAGFPIVGDRHYGADDVSDLKLASVELGFTHPRTGEPIKFELPADQRPALQEAN